MKVDWQFQNSNFNLMISGNYGMEDAFANVKRQYSHGSEAIVGMSQQVMMSDLLSSPPISKS